MSLPKNTISPPSEVTKPPVISRQNLSRLFLVLAIVAVFSAGFFTGNRVSIGSSQLDLTQFWQVYRFINDRYVGNVDNKKAAEGAAAGLVSSLGDPFSSFLPPEDRKNLDDELKGEFEGIGAELTQKDQLITVVAPLAGSPAETAGLKANDIVIKIDGQSTEGMSLDDAVKKIRGQKGTSVSLAVQRQGKSDAIELKITRENIQVKSVKSKMIGTVGYIEVNQFGDDTVDLFRAAVKDIAAQKATAVVVDLRNNPGGYLNAVGPVVGQFVAPSVVTIEKYKSGKTDEVRSTDVPLLPNTPLFLLVNGGSASAAEIMAGALQDDKRATLIGQKTFGKGSVQDIIPLTGGAALRITIAEWLTPNKRAINKVGIEPDVKVDGEKTANADPVLDKALELAKPR